MTRQLVGSGIVGLWIVCDNLAVAVAALFAVIPWLIVTLEIVGG